MQHGLDGHVQGHGLRASQAASGRALGMNGGGELWTTGAQPWYLSASGSGESWRESWNLPSRAWEEAIFIQMEFDSSCCCFRLAS